MASSWTSCCAAATFFGENHKGASPREFYDAGVEGALCDDETRARLRRIGDGFDWASLDGTD